MVKHLLLGGYIKGRDWTRSGPSVCNFITTGCISSSTGIKWLWEDDKLASHSRFDSFRVLTYRTQKHPIRLGAVKFLPQKRGEDDDKLQKPDWLFAVAKSLIDHKGVESVSCFKAISPIIITLTLSLAESAVVVYHVAANFGIPVLAVTKNIPMT